MPFTFTPLAIPEVVLVQPSSMGDDRGIFRETFKASAFAEAGLPDRFLQDNLSTSKKGVLRGLHFQRDPHAQGKLVSVASGAVFDVAADIRVGSPTYGQWVSAELTAENGSLLWIPAGFAHGFCVLGDEPATLAYKVTAEYSHPHDGGLVWDDPEIGVAWPISDPILSEKDQKLPPLANCDHGFTFRAG
jgi:dTDP-4-dehydrorhamnose 3,5-epimerase